MKKSIRISLIIIAAIVVLSAVCLICYRMCSNSKARSVKKISRVEPIKDTSSVTTPTESLLSPPPPDLPSTPIVDSTVKPIVDLQFIDYVISDTTYNYVFYEEDIPRTYFFYHEMEFPIASSNPTILRKIQKDLVNRFYKVNDGITYEMREPDIVGDLWTCPLKKELTSYSPNLTPLDTTVWDVENRYFHHYCGRSYAFSSRTWTYLVEYALYLGGTHGACGRYYICYDLSTGKQLKIEDILEGDYQNGLKPYMVSWLEDYEINVRHEKSAFFDHRYVVPNNKFYIDNKGITFYFGAYSIACYAFGEREIPVPKELIKPYLKPQWKNLWD
ncbi:MAG: DUF3298 domain-containing protein [Prevotellaceae bacterium]|nr:DUF3298 domain-containing protein [Candidatus Faecinaster equi]